MLEVGCNLGGVVVSKSVVEDENFAKVSFEEGEVRVFSSDAKIELGYPGVGSEGAKGRYGIAFNAIDVLLKIGKAKSDSDHVRTGANCGTFPVVQSRIGRVVGGAISPLCKMIPGFDPKIGFQWSDPELTQEGVIGRGIGTIEDIEKIELILREDESGSMKVLIDTVEADCGSAVNGVGD